MSAVIETFLICDGHCGSNYGVDTRGDTAKRHRKSAKNDGWSYVNGKDFCPDCYKKLSQVKLTDYNNLYGQPRTQQEVKDFFQKSDLTWGDKPHEQGI